MVRLLASHAQAGTYPSIRQISTRNRASRSKNLPLGALYQGTTSVVPIAAQKTPGL
jgi:hypothetical protein